MKVSRIFATAFTLVVIASGLTHGEEMKPLFDGKSMAGWTQIGGKNKGVWKVENGLLVMEGEGGG
ncbi:MAG: hypothetical protein ACKO5E_10930, partial [bacterium]